MRTLLLLGLVVAAHSSMLKERVMRHINLFNFRAKCWGEDNMQKFIVQSYQAQEACMQMEPSMELQLMMKPHQNPFSPLGQQTNPFRQLTNNLANDLDKLTSLWRTKREATAGLLKPDKEDLYEFLHDFAMWKGDMAKNIGNLTCVLVQMKMLTDDLSINMDFYNDVLGSEEFPPAEGTPTNDPVWVEKLKTGYNDCHKISETWPQASLNRNPVTKMFGRHMIFFKCVDKVETHLCASAQILDWLVTLYGSDPEEDLTQYGLPEDRYDAAAISLAVLENAANEQEQFVSEFFWGMNTKNF